MATLQEQVEMENLLRQTNDAHYRLYLALFKFSTVVQYFDVIPEERFAEVEKALAEVEDTLVKVRAAMATYMHDEVRLACHFSGISDMSC